MSITNCNSKFKKKPGFFLLYEISITIIITITLSSIIAMSYINLINNINFQRDRLQALQYCISACEYLKSAQNQRSIEALNKKILGDDYKKYEILMIFNPSDLYGFKDITIEVCYRDDNKRIISLGVGI